MSRQSFKNYGRVAEGIADYTVVSGRYKIQEEAGKNIIKDVLDKLDLKTNDTVLEIGCGGGIY